MSPLTFQAFLIFQDQLEAVLNIIHYCLSLSENPSVTGAGTQQLTIILSLVIYDSLVALDVKSCFLNDTVTVSSKSASALLSLVRARHIALNNLLFGPYHSFRDQSLSGKSITKWRGSMLQ